MIFRKLCSFLLVVWLVFQTTALAAPTRAPEVKGGKLSPDLKRNALKLLSVLAIETRQFNLPENRVRAGTIVGDLMWEHDESKGREIYQAAFAELQNLFADINATQLEEMSSAERLEHFYKRLRLAELRRELVLTLARHDSQAALAALAALKTKKVAGYDPLAATETELQIAATIAQKDPDKTYALTKQQIAAKGITLEFIESLKDLHKRDSALAARIGRDALAEIKNAKIRTPSAGGDASSEPANSNSSTRPKQTEIELWMVSAFVNAASEMNRRATRDKEKKTLPLLAEAEMKELVELIARAFLTERNPAQYSVGQVMGEITRYAPAQAQRIRLKVGAKVARELDRVIESSEYSATFDEKSSDELAQIAARAAPDMRDQRYVDAVRRAIEEDNPEKAQMIAERIKDRENYDYVFEQIKTALPLAKARRGDLVEVRKMLATLKTNGERIAALTELAVALAAKGDNRTAKSLLDESRQMMPALVKTKADLELAAKLAAGYCPVAPEQAFALVEGGIAQTNELVNAGIALDEFYDYDSVEAGELHYDSINKRALLHIPNTIELLKNLARADFQRTVSLADKFARPEIRLFARLRIVQALLDAEAAEKEKKMRERVESEDREH